MRKPNRLHTNEVNGVTVVRFVDSELIHDEIISQIGRELRMLVNPEQHTQLLLDFSGVTFFSTAVLNQLMLLNKAVGKSGGNIRLCCLHSQIRDIFRICRLDRVFDIVESQQRGLAMF
jgi:anti-sigma B factor antagonist